MVAVLAPGQIARRPARPAADWGPRSRPAVGPRDRIPRRTLVGNPRLALAGNPRLALRPVPRLALVQLPRLTLRPVPRLALVQLPRLTLRPVPRLALVLPRLALGVAVVAGLLVGLASPAGAEPPSRLDSPITDTVGALTGAEDEVADALAELEEQSLQLWVAYVATFDGLTGEQWADATAVQSGLGGNDVLFAVAVQDRAYGYSIDDAASDAVNDADVERVIAEDVEPQLRAGDWPGAVVALADGLGEAAAAQDSGGTDSGGGVRWGVLLAVGLLLVGVLVLLRRARRGSAGRGRGTAPQQESIESLRQRAAAALIEADDAIRTSEQELGFAIAQFGDEAAVPFTQALATARTDLHRAFEVQRLAQELADGSAPAPTPAAPAPGARAPATPTQSDAAARAPDTPLSAAPTPGAPAPGTPAPAATPAVPAPGIRAPGAPASGTSTGPEPAPAAPMTERAALERILTLCAAVDEALDAQVEHFDQLRDLEASLDTVLPALTARAAELTARLPGSRATVEDLAARYPPAAIAWVGANLEEADERLGFAQSALDKGGALLTADDRGGAATRARAAEEALGQVSTLLDSVDGAPAVLDLAVRSVTALMAETERDLAESESLGAVDRLGPVHHFASETLAWARSAVESGSYDPVQVRRALEESDAALERALVAEREVAATRARAVALLPTATEAAEVSVRIADEFIATRRGAVGSEARSRLAQAQRLLSEARLLTDPVAALAQMQAVDHLADQATTLAQQDVARYSDRQRRGGGPGNLGSAILGGILIDSMTRGGRAPGGWSSGSRATGGRAPGSFGGGGTRSRRGGGGRF